MTQGATRMKSAVRAVSPSSISHSMVDATRHARARSPRSSSSLNTGTNAAESAASATRARKKFGIWNATVNALIPSPCTPKRPLTTISRTSPAMRERPVASEKTAVDQANRRAWPASVAAAGESLTDARSPGWTRSPAAGALAHLRGRARRSGATIGAAANRRPPRVYAEHQAAEEARPHRGPRAAREPPLPVVRQDVYAPPARRSRERRRRARHRRARPARQASGPRGVAWRAAPQHRRPQESGRGALRARD